MSLFTQISPSCQIPHLNELYERYFSGIQHGTFVEVGANDGYSWSNTWGLAELGWRGLYIEPVKALAEQCLQRHAHNNVTIVNAAAASFFGETKLYTGEGATTSPKVAQENTFFYGNSPDKFEIVPAITLNYALKVHEIRHDFELLVIDVDGDEVGVLQGLDLERWQPKMVIIETNRDHPHVAWRFNALGIDQILCRHYLEIYHDHINSIYVRKPKCECQKCTCSLKPIEQVNP